QIVDRRVHAARRTARADPARTGGAGRSGRRPDRDPGGCPGRLATCPAGRRTDSAGRPGADRDPGLRPLPPPPCRAPRPGVHGHQPAPGCRDVARAFTVTNPAKVARTAAVVNRLPRFPDGTFSCPAEFGGQMRLTFATRPGGAVLAPLGPAYRGVRG